MTHVRASALLLLTVMLAGAALLLAAVAPAATAAGSVGAEYKRWVLHGWTVRPEDYTDQGLTTVTTSSGTRVVTRGDDSIPPALAAAGWQHIGDPDAVGGYLLDAYQGTATSRTKLYTLTTPSGAVYRYVHRLTPGEAYNNSFTAIAPGSHWFVSGEWGTMRRLLVFRMPTLPPSGPRVRSLPLASLIKLNRPVRNVQGCDFSSATSLVCSTNDPGNDLFGVARQLLTVHLAHPLDGRPTTGSVSLLGPVPGVTVCQGTAEVEGIDIRAGRMLVSVVSACTHTTTIFDFRLEASGHATRP